MSTTSSPIRHFVSYDFHGNPYLTLGVLLSFNSSHQWSLQQIEPALLIALEKINKNYYIISTNSSNHSNQILKWRLRIIAADSQCSDKWAPLAAFETKSIVDAFIGPACSYALAPVARYTSHWNMALLTAGSGSSIKAFTDKKEYQLLTRLSSPSNKLGFFLVDVLKKQFNWNNFGFIYFDDKNEKEKKNIIEDQSTTLSRECYFTLEAVYAELERRKGGGSKGIMVKKIIKNQYKKLLLSASTKSRIVLMCAPNDLIRSVILEADELGFNNGEYVFINIDLFSSKDLQEKPWYRREDDEKTNLMAKKAFESLLLVTLSRQNSLNFKRFSSQVRRKSVEKYGRDVYREEVNDYVGSFHDALLLYSLAVNETIRDGIDPKNGAEVTKRMWGRTFRGITGEVSIDSNGDREEDYVILNMDPDSGLFGVMGTFIGKNQSFIKNQNRPVFWPGNRTDPPPDVPKCGFDGKGCPKNDFFPISAIITIVLSLIVIVMSIVVAILCKHMREEAALAEVYWRVKWDDITFPNRNFRGERRGSSSTLASLETLSEADNKQIYTITGHYKSQVVAIKKLDRPFTITKPLLIRIKKLRDLQHDHVTRFIGICIDADHHSVITEYCQKGSLYDVLENDSINLDRMFKYSLIQDLVKGMAYLHDSDIRYHGNLKSSNCVVDSRFVLKVTDFGFLATKADEYKDGCRDPDEYYKTKLWTAPEHLRALEKVSSPSHKKISTTTPPVLLSNTSINKHFLSAPHIHKSSITSPSLITPTPSSINNFNAIGYWGSRGGAWDKREWGSPKGDVYSFGIICQEILLRKGVFWVKTEQVTPREIIHLVMAETKPHFRPTLQVTEVSEELVEEEVCLLVYRCWHEDPLERPDFHFIKNFIKKTLKDLGGGSLLDNLLNRMEQYACNLEGLVQEKTAGYLEQKKKAENLLYMMLPRSVASQLMQGRTVKAEKYEGVTIYFSDICGFTFLSAISTPIQIVDLLNDLYSSFDEIIGKYDVYKVETIGDAYMVVSGCPALNGTLHAREICRMSLTLLNEVKNFKIRHRPQDRLMLRIGVHSGPVCAGVVGHKMPRYCLFGDTVNTASRMESNGEALKIHVSPDTKSILGSSFILQFRGPVHMKGKGEICTWWLIGEDQSKLL